MTHYHHGHGLTGYGPEEPDTCDSIRCLADCVHRSLGAIADAWRDQAHGERTHVAQLVAMRTSGGGEPTGYEGSWESIGTAAMRALDCLDGAEDAEHLASDIRADRESAPAYQGNPGAWEQELRRLLLGSGTYPLETDVTGNHRFHVWECWDWRCLLSEHDAGYEIPAASVSGGYVPCACRDCMGILVWSPDTGGAPYCPGCVGADCAHRDRAGCAA